MSSIVHQWSSYLQCACRHTPLVFKGSNQRTQPSDSLSQSGFQHLCVFVHFFSGVRCTAHRPRTRIQRFSPDVSTGLSLTTVSNDAGSESLVDEDDSADDETKSTPDAVTAASGSEKEPLKVPVPAATKSMHEWSDGEVDTAIGSGCDDRVKDGHAEGTAEQDGDVGNVVRPLRDKVKADAITATGEILTNELAVRLVLANHINESSQNSPGEEVEGMKGFDLHGTGEKAAGAVDDFAVEMESYANSSWNRTAPTPGETVRQSYLGLGDEGPGEFDDLSVSARSSTQLRKTFRGPEKGETCRLLSVRNTNCWAIPTGYRHEYRVIPAARLLSNFPQ